MESPFDRDLSRRVFIKGVGFVSFGLFMGLFGGCESWWKAIQNRPLRRRLRTGSPEVDADIATYRQAVSLMKGLPSSDPRNWINFATIHGTTAGFNYCQHGTYHFFDWHRAYLFYFEKICQKLTDNAHFGLPYWNWNQNPDIHPAFLDPMSSLYAARSQTSASALSTINTADLDPILADTNFYTYSTQIEGTPHNSVHSYVGGAGLFGGGASAQDPIFWMHHCMVDYCWAKWTIELGNNTTNDPSWANTTDDHFVDADGNPASISAALTTIMPLLSYRYESSAIGSYAAKELLKNRFELERLEARLRAGADVRFEIKRRLLVEERATITLDRPFSRETKSTTRDFVDIIENDPGKNRVFASVDYVKLPPENDFFVRVFINLPGADRHTQTTDPHYAGSFAFFGTDTGEANPMGHHHAPHFLVNITETLQRLKSRQLLADRDHLSVQLVAEPFSGKFEREGTELILDKVELIVTPVIVNSEK